MRPAVAIVLAAALVLASCSGGEGDPFSALDGGGSDPPTTSGIDPCSLLTEAELSAVLGVVPEPKESEPAGPFTGCTWGTGMVFVSIAPAVSVILAPGEDECPPAGIGDESYSCEGRVKFLTNGIHVSVSTIDNLTSDQLVTLAQDVLPKLQE